MTTADDENDDEESSGGEAEDDDQALLQNYPPILESESAMAYPLNRVDEENLPIDPAIIPRRVPSEPIDDFVFIDDDLVDDELGMDDINDSDNSSSESKQHLDEGTDDDDDSSIPVNQESFLVHLHRRSRHGSCCSGMMSIFFEVPARGCSRSTCLSVLFLKWSYMVTKWG
ncbi:hypothetical protein F2P56_022823 [Juglans regia]|uniref:Uncharacterized protein n=1 Tax=Juglans regia TaxID=51240 RepID=A0A833U8U0_JUGRE|nr:hypothetical protein F2P56_022823 [Juglans regia]